MSSSSGHRSSDFANQSSMQLSSRSSGRENLSQANSRESRAPTPSSVSVQSSSNAGGTARSNDAQRTIAELTLRSGATDTSDLLDPTAFQERQTRLKDLEKWRKELSNRRKGLIARNAELQTMLNKLDDGETVRSLREQLATVTGEKESLAIQKDSLGKQVSTLQQNNDDLTQRVQTLEQTRADETATLNQFSDKYEKLFDNFEEVSHRMRKHQSEAARDKGSSDDIFPEFPKSRDRQP